MTETDSKTPTVHDALNNLALVALQLQLAIGTLRDSTTKPEQVPPAPVSAPMTIMHEAVAEPAVAPAPAPEPPKKTLADLVRDRQCFFVKKRDQLLADEKSRKPLYDDGLTDALAEAVGTTPLYDGKGHWANVRAGDAFDVNGATVAARKSPWNDIRCAMLRNETCVLYCKHADDGWTDSLWGAAVKHLATNGVFLQFARRFHHPRDGTGPVPWTEYWVLHWGH